MRMFDVLSFSTHELGRGEHEGLTGKELENTTLARLLHVEDMHICKILSFHVKRCQRHEARVDGESECRACGVG